MKTTIGLDNLGLNELSRKDLMSVEGGFWGQIGRMVYRVARDAVICKALTYTLRRMSTRKPTNLPPNYYCE